MSNLQHQIINDNKFNIERSVATANAWENYYLYHKLDWKLALPIFNNKCWKCMIVDNSTR